MRLSSSSELDAVNEILSFLGMLPINSLEGQLPPDAVHAKNALKVASREVQSRGCHFNTEHEYTLPLTSSMEIVAPINTLALKEATGNLVLRGKRVYDKAAHRYTHDNPLTATLVFFLGFDELPEYARRLITLRAAASMQEQRLGSSELYRTLEREVGQATVDFQRAELEKGGYRLDVN